MLIISHKNKKSRQKRTLRRVFLVSLLALLVLGEVVVPAQASSVTAGAIMRLANDSRQKAGLHELKQNDLLKKAAEAKAKDMFKNDYFAHTSPKGVTPWHWLKQAGYAYGFAGENLAINYGNAESQHKAWMKSPTHRANILSDKYQEIGVAVVAGKIDGKEALVTVQVFASPKVAPVVTKPISTLPSSETLAADVKGVEQELQEIMLGEAVKEPAPVSEIAPRLEPATPVTTNTKSEFDLYIVLTWVMLQIVILASAMPFLYQSAERLWRFYGLLKMKVEPILALETHFEGIHAFDIHYPKAL